MKITTIKIGVLLLFIAFISSNVATAQITIGSTTAPCEGALLDLKEENETTKGLGLPRVSLISNKSLEPCLASDIADDATERKKHVGLVVYNVGTEIETTKEDRFCKGLHVWNGTKWEPLIPYFDPDKTRSGRKEDLTIKRGPSDTEVTTYTTAYFHGYSRASTSATPSPTTGSVYVCDKSKLVEIDAGQWMTMNMRTQYLPGETTKIVLDDGDKHLLARYIEPQNPAGLSAIDVERNGLLYNWPAASANRDPSGILKTSEYTGTPRVQGICPTGWHLPDIQELLQLSHLFRAQHYLFSTAPFAYTPSTANAEATAAAMTSTFSGGKSFSPEEGGIDWRRVGARWQNWKSQSSASAYGKAGFFWSSSSGIIDDAAASPALWNYRAFHMTNGFVRYLLGGNKDKDTNKEVITAAQYSSFRSRVAHQSVRCKKD